MDIVIWIVQGIVAVMFLMAGLMKASQPGDKLREKMAWANDYSVDMLRFIGISEVLGAVGLIVPQLTGILPQLVWVSAAALALVMLLAIRVHAKRKENKELGINLFLFILLVFIAYSRFAM